MARLLATALGCLLAALVAPPTPAGATAVVRLAPAATVAGDGVRLGDLAEFAGDPALVDRLRALRLGPAPAAGVTIRLETGTVRARLRDLGTDADAVELVGPERVAVTRAFQVIAGSTLVDIARRRAVEQLGAQEASDAARAGLVLTPVSVPEDLRLPTGQVDTGVRVQPGPSGSAFLTAAVTLSVDGREWQTVPLSFRVGRAQSVVVAVQPLEPHRALSPADFRVETRASTDTPPDALGSLEDVADLEPVRSVKPGEVITARLLRPKLLVRRGELVTLVAEGRGFRVTAQGQAREDARRGDVVRVLNITSRREVLGQVESAGLVRVPIISSRSER